MLYFSTLSSAKSELALRSALRQVQQTLSLEDDTSLYELYYEQATGSSKSSVNGQEFKFLPPLRDLAFNDSTLEAVQEAWQHVRGSMNQDEEVKYMKFEDREGMGDDNEVYE